MKKKIFRWAKVLILLYCTGGIVVYYGQDSLLFHPVVLDKNTRYDLGQPYKEINLPYDKETSLNIIQFRPPDSALQASDSMRPGTARGVVLYFHGNRTNISRYAPFAPNFTSRGYEVWMIDYPGFGKSRGKFTEQKLYDYALQLYKLARSRYKPSEIILYGKSLGTCLATELANARDCRRLILETPCYSMTSLIRHWLPFYPVGTMLHYRFPNNEWLSGVTAPVSIFHGTDDGVIPYSNASRLKPLLKPGDEFITIDGGSHNDLNKFPLFHQKLDSLLDK
ncbi:MAG TPA: alpha/beta fold hydrolase [Puia sp.]|nr:alpha/beta fold hydrolase [Puia sp.]